MKYCIGADVGGTSIKLGAVDEQGELLLKWETKTRKGDNGKLFLKDIADGIMDAIGSHEKLKHGELLGVGLDVPGPVLPNGYVELCPNLGVRKLYPAKELSKLIGGIPVRIANDANAAALGEMWQGAGKGHGSICMVTLGTGVGGGIVSEGHIFYGSHGAGGELGHMRVDDTETENCNCGGRGCLEQYASATGIARVARRMLDKSDEDSGLRAIKDINAKDVCDLAKAGDELALKALSYSMDRLSYALSLVAITTDPEVFVVGGGVSKAGDILIELIKKGLANYQSLIGADRYEVALAELGNDAGIYGAAKLMLPEK